VVAAWIVGRGLFVHVCIIAVLVGVASTSITLTVHGVAAVVATVVVAAVVVLHMLVAAIIAVGTVGRLQFESLSAVGIHAVILVGSVGVRLLLRSIIAAWL